MAALAAVGVQRGADPDHKGHTMADDKDILRAEILKARVEKGLRLLARGKQQWTGDSLLQRLKAS